jgi:hypothetical protein
MIFTQVQNLFFAKMIRLQVISSNQMLNHGNF